MKPSLRLLHRKPRKTERETEAYELEKYSRRVEEVLRYLPVSRDDVDNTHIVSGMGMSEIPRILENVEFSEPEKIEGVPDRYISSYYPLNILSKETGLELKAEFYEINNVPWYILYEPPVSYSTRKIYVFIRQRLSEVIVSKYDDFIPFVKDLFSRIVGVSPTVITESPIKEAVYYVFRDLFLYGPITAFMLDPDVEEISWYHYDYPVQVVDRIVSNKYGIEFIPTNVFIDRSLDITARKMLITQYIKSIVARTGKSLTVANPKVEARIMDIGGIGFHRLAATLDVVSRSANITIRKFPQRRYSITELVIKNTLSPLEAAYLIYIILHRGFILIVGPMASGKTSLLLALISTIPITYKVITIEDTPELSTPSINWHPFYTRPAPKGTELAHIDYPELVQHSLRHRGFVVTLGEVRGKEMAYLIQAASSGHGAACTFHADDPFTVLMRITSPPINAPVESLKLIDSIISISKVRLLSKEKESTGRRVRRIYEIKDIVTTAGGLRVPEVVEVFKWSPVSDKHSPLSTLDGVLDLWEKSRVVRKYAESDYDVNSPYAIADIYLLAKYIELMAQKTLVDISQVMWAISGFIIRLPEYRRKKWPEIRSAIIKRYGSLDAARNPEQGGGGRA